MLPGQPLVVCRPLPRRRPTVRSARGRAPPSSPRRLFAPTFGFGWQQPWLRRWLRPACRCRNLPCIPRCAGRRAPEACFSLSVAPLAGATAPCQTQGETLVMLTILRACAPSQAGNRRRAAIAAVMAALAIGLACREAAAQPTNYKVGDLTIEAPWARATPAGAKVGGAYLKIINNGAQPDRLLGGSLTGAGDVEVHEMSMSNNVMKMRQLKDGLEIKPGQTVELKPGGYHLMLTGLHDGLKQGQKLTGMLRFEKAGTVQIEFAIAPIGAQSGGHMQH